MDPHEQESVSKGYVSIELSNLEKLIDEKIRHLNVLIVRSDATVATRFATLELIINEKGKSDLQAIEKSTLISQERIMALEKLIEARTTADRIAINKASESIDERLRGMNEFRQALSDQTSTFITRNESDLTHKAIAEKVESLQKIIYIGLGALAAIQFLFQYFMG